MSKQSLSPIEKSVKKRIFGISFSRRQLIIFLLVFGAIGGAVLYKTLVTRGANFSWLQTSWSGGASTTARASHSNNQTGWTQYESKDTLLSTSTEGELTLTASTSSNIDTTFSPASSTSNVYVDNGTVKLKKPDGLPCSSATECTSGLCNVSCGIPSVGDTYQGGKVFYISGGHGLIAQTSDISTGAAWGCYGSTISGADSTTNGAQNTIDIVAGCSTAGIAARLCSDSTTNGYTDWYLPAKNQLNTLYTQRTAVGGFTTSNYWSSSESSIYAAWYQNFNNGLQGGSGYTKSNSYYVRCIRSF